MFVFASPFFPSYFFFFLSFIRQGPRPRLGCDCGAGQVPLVEHMERSDHIILLCLSHFAP